MYIATALIIITIVGIQCVRKRFLTSTTMFLAYYFCFYILSPLLLEYHAVKVDRAAFIGIVAFLMGYISISLATYNGKVSIKTKSSNLNAELCEDWCGLLFKITVVSLILKLGFNGIHAIFTGNLTLRTLIHEESGIFSLIHNYSNIYWGFFIILAVVSQKGKMNVNLWKNFVYYCAINFVFSYTRSLVIYIIGMLAISFLANKKIHEQIMICCLIIIICVLLMCIMGAVRTWGLHEGINRIDIKYLLNSLSGSLDFTIIYKAIEDLLSTEVKITPLVYLKVLFFIIPRSIWPNKPYASSVEILMQLDMSARSRGYSTGYGLLGEAYAVCGEIGFILYPFVFAILTGIADMYFVRKIRNNENNDFFAFFLLYFMFVFLLESFRQGLDIAIMDLPIKVLPVWIISKLKIKMANRRLIG